MGPSGIQPNIVQMSRGPVNWTNKYHIWHINMAYLSQSKVEFEKSPFGRRSVSEEQLLGRYDQPAEA